MRRLLISLAVVLSLATPAPAQFAYPGSRPHQGQSRLNRLTVGGVAVPSASTPSITINAQTGTTYTVVAGDQAKLLTFSNGSNIAVTLPQATGSFGSGWYADFRNIGTGNVTITPTTSTVGGKTAIFIIQGGTVRLISDGTNYQVLPLTAFTSIYTTYQGLSVQIPDNGTTGGNARGVDAVDLQFLRNNAAQVASGNYSFCAGVYNFCSNDAAVAHGWNNTASGAFTFASGYVNSASSDYATAIGKSNTASGNTSMSLGYANTTSGTLTYSFGENNSSTTNQDAMTIGSANTASGAQGIALGYQNRARGTKTLSMGYGGDDHGNTGQVSVGLGGQTVGGLTPGRAQFRQNAFWATYSGSSSVRLTTDGAAASSTNVGALDCLGCSQAKDAISYQVECLFIDQTANTFVTYTIGSSLIYRTNGAATTTVSGSNPTAVLGPTGGSPGSFQVAPTVTADTTNGGFNISTTPPTGNTDQWDLVCRVYGTEVAYG